MRIVKSVLLLTTVAALIMSCATTQSVITDNGVEAQRMGNRVYVQDPYYGTVILEQDPITGRYFDVTNGFGRGFNSPYYGGWNNYRRFGGGFYPNYRVYGTRPASPRLAVPQQNKPLPPAQRGDPRPRVLGGGR